MAAFGVLLIPEFTRWWSSPLLPNERPTYAPTPQPPSPQPAAPTPSIDLATVLPPLIIVGAIIVGVAVASVVFSLVQMRARRKALKEIRDLERRFENEPPDFKQIWTVTQRRLEYYHEIATSQSRQSFISTQISTGLGFLLISLVGWIASQAPTDIGRISAGAVGVVGGALSAYIGRTFMKAQSEASAQLRQFFLQPVEFSRLLGLERLIETLPEEERATAVHQIVRSVMPSITGHPEPEKAAPPAPKAEPPAKKRWRWPFG
jgi:hypothetical protein